MTKARAVMNTCVISVNQDEDIYEAIRMLVLNNITGLPVVDEKQKLVGVITEKDVLTLLYNLQDKPGTVKEFMTPNVVCFDQEDDLNDVVESLRTNHFRRVPILDKGRLVGIISRRDIITYIRDLKHEDQALKDSLLELVF
ncbi:MAG: CBS domain-containing protein [Phycisphaerales bacterium]